VESVGEVEKKSQYDHQHDNERDVHRGESCISPPPPPPPEKPPLLDHEPPPPLDDDDVKLVKTEELKVSPSNQSGVPFIYSACSLSTHWSSTPHSPAYGRRRS